MTSRIEGDVEETNRYLVEVSGWDAFENFFVEKAMLDWRPGEKKMIPLRCTLREGAIVFVRLLQPLAKSSGFPVVYQATKVMDRDAVGLVRVQLTKMHPRAQEKEIEPIVRIPVVTAA
jgi:hypothetical protein